MLWFKKKLPDHFKIVDLLLQASLPKKNVRAGSINDVITDKESSASNVGVWIGVALGLIVVIGT